MWHALDYQTFSQFTPYLPLAKNDCIFSFKEKDDDEAKEEGRVGGGARLGTGRGGGKPSTSKEWK